MVIYYYQTKFQIGEYNIVLIKELCRIHGVEITDNPQLADAVFVSICDIVEMKLILKAKLFGKPVIAGGFAGYFPVARYWADYVVHGEAYNFIREFSKLKNIEDIRHIRNVSTWDKIGEFDEYIDYSLNPIVKVTKKGHYYYTGKGCPQKCKFCLMSYMQEYKTAPDKYLHRAFKSLPEGGLLFPMSSYFNYDIKRSEAKRLGCLDIKIKEYIHNSGVNTGRRIRTAIEFVSEENRKKLAKPMKDDEITEFIRITYQQKKEVVLYFIGGVETQEQIIDWIETTFPHNYNLKPRITMIFTMLDPQPTTPFQAFDISKRIELSGEAIFKEAQKINRRIRVHRIKYIAHSFWRTILQRATTEEEIAFAWSFRNMKDINKIRDATFKFYPHLIGDESLEDVKLLKRQRRDYPGIPIGRYGLPSKSGIA